MNTQKTGGLGRGLGSLIPQKNLAAGTKEKDETVLEVPVHKIAPNSRQPRTEFDHQAADELTESVREHGILQPLIVVKKGDGYELIAGERRLRAAKAAGLATVPVVVRAADEQQKLAISLIENIQRQNLNPIEEARSYNVLHEEFGLSQEAIARKVGKSRPVIANTMRLLELPQNIQRALAEKKIPYTTGRALLALKPEEQSKTFSQLVSGEKISIAEIEKKAPPKRRFEDPNLKAAEASLREALGTKVTVKRRGQNGSVIIEFYSDEELGSIVRRLTG